MQVGKEYEGYFFVRTSDVEAQVQTTPTLLVALRNYETGAILDSQSFDLYNLTTTYQQVTLRDPKGFHGIV